MGQDQRVHFGRMVSIGDSFTEGMGDEDAAGRPRGWADRAATVLAEEYANLAIRGRLLGAIVDEQVDAALRLRPDLVTLNGGGNDMMRPRVDPLMLQRLLDLTLARFTDAGITTVLISGADPSDHLPMGARLRRQGDRLCDLAAEVADCRGAVMIDMWRVEELRDRRYWSADRLHLNAAGHARVAARVVQTLGGRPPVEWIAPVPAVPAPARPVREKVHYYREHVVPWVQRRLTGRSSGDTRTAKYPTPVPTADLLTATG